MRLRVAIFIVTFVTFPLLAGLNRWTIDGPAGGKVNQFTTDPAIPSTIYAATSNGLYRSADAGQHWIAAPEMAGTTVYNVVVTPADPARVYAATFAGLMRSNDRGLTWTNISPQFTVALQVGVSPSNADVVYLVTTQGGLRASTDGGLTFGSAGTGLPVATVSAIRVDPQAPATVYVAFNSEDAMYKSTDSGAHWSAANHGLPGVIYALEIDPANGNTLYAAGQGGVHKSTDGGGSWSPLNLGTQTGYAYAVAIDRPTPSTLFAAAANGLFKSVDAGAHWTALGGLTFNVLAVAINSYDGLNLVICADFKVYRSTDGGVMATETANGLTAVSAAAIVTDPNDASTVYVGGMSGIYKSSDYGRTWTSTGRMARGLAIDGTDSRTLYMLFFNALYRSVDGGSTWDGFTTGLPQDSATVIATPPGIHGRIYAINNGFVYRRDGESPFTLLTNNLPPGGVTALAFDPSNGQSVFAVAATGLFTSTDGGTTWHSASIPAGLSPAGVAVDPFDAKHRFLWSDAAAWVTSDSGTSWAPVEWVFKSTLVFDPKTPGRVYRNSAPILHRSEDGGKSWTRLIYGLGPISGELLAIGRDGTLYKGGSDGGVYVYQFGHPRAVRR